MQKIPSGPLEASRSAAERRYLYATAAFTGAAIMIVEILGAKMLAPFLGTSHFVWTAQIAVTLVALATGYYVGGRWADRSPRLHALYIAILVAALYLCAATPLVERVAYGCLRLRLAMGSFLASTFLFFVPLALLATVGPFLVRVITRSVDNVGASVGRLTAISTLGSFAGTLLIGYVLIPLLPNSFTMILTAIGLMLVAGGYLLTWGGRARIRYATTLLVLLTLAGAVASQSNRPHRGESFDEIFRGNSNFGLLQVLQGRGNARRYFLNDYLTQNTYDTNAQKSLAMFTYMLHDLARAYTTNLTDALCIGLGVGLVPMDFARAGVRVDVAEINPAVVPVARQYFGLEPERLNLVIADGRQFVNESQRLYDAIVLDAFLGDSSPAHLMSREAFAGMRRLLRPGGVLVINCFGDFDPGRDFFVASLQKTLTNVFTSVRIHNHHNGGNVFFVASSSALSLHRPPTFDHVHPVCRLSVEGAFARVIEANPDHGIVLTDDFNPLEYHDAANRERIRRDLALAVKEY